MKRILKYKRFTIISVTVIVAMFSLGVGASGVEANIDEYNEEFDFSRFLDTLDDNTVEILSQLGISSLSFDDIFSVSPQKVMEALFSIGEKAVKEPLRFMFTALGIVAVTTIVSSFSGSGDGVSLLGGAFLALSLAVPVANVITTAFSVLQSLNAFTTAFSGVFCGVVSASGQINAGVSYGALSVFSNSLFTGILTEICTPVVNAMCSLGFLSCFDLMGFTGRLCEITKKLYVFLISLIGTVFSGIVTLKGVLSGGADTLATRSIRFVVGRSLPVVGGAVSETYTSVLNGLQLIKNTVGVFGIITVIVVVLPSLLQLFCWVAVLEITNSVADGFGTCNTGGMVGVIKDALVLLIATIVIITAIFIVSVGVVIAVKGGAV